MFAELLVTFNLIYIRKIIYLFFLGGLMILLSLNVINVAEDSEKHKLLSDDYLEICRKLCDIKKVLFSPLFHCICISQVLVE